jgi:hypothetical protein
MKKIFNYMFFGVLLLCIAACDNGFDELNTSKVNVTSIDPVFQLNNATINASYGTGSGGGSVLIYDVGIVQQVITPNSGVVTGANYNQDNRDATQSLWQGYYRNVIRNTRDVIKVTQNMPDRGNLMHMARIFQAFAFMVLTDTYGDIPYEQGGLGYLDRVLFPAYDAQEDIYEDLIRELGEATAALNASGRIESADVLYGGSVDKWKKFGYSLMLRAGMRLSKINPTRAEAIAQSAFQGGVITTNADNAVIRHTDNFVNGIGNTLNATEASNFYLAAPFVNHLKNTGDPRLAAIAVRYLGAKSGPEQVSDPTKSEYNGTNDPAMQVGMPLGYNNSTIVPVAQGLGLASFYEFSQVDRTRMAKRTAPTFLVTAAQTLLLLAEARQRGWITTGTAEEYFSNGIRAHMEQLASYDIRSAVPAAAADTYISNNPLSAATALEQINTQYWIASFLNGPEAFANFRRSGYPQLIPNPFPGKGIAGDFIRRLTYPNSEISVNTANVNTAIQRMGPDNLDTRVWWDKP